MLENPPVPDMQLPVDFQRTLELSGFIPNIQLLQPLSEIVANPPKDAQEEPKPGNYWFGTNISLGDSFDAIPFAAAVHALLVVDKKMQKESFDHTSDIFKEVQQLAENRKSLPNGTVARWGVDVLLYVPAVRRYGVYFLFSTARNIARDFTANPGKMVLVKRKLIKNKQGQSWWSPDIFATDGAVPDVVKEEMPDPAEYIAKFKKRKPRMAQTGSAGDDGKDR